MSKRKHRIVLEGLSFKVDKFIIERETEIENHASLEDDVHEVVGRVISAPAQLLALDATATTQTPQEPVVPSSLPTAQSNKRRRRRRHHGDTAEMADRDEPGENGPAPNRSTKPNSARSLIQGLHAHGYFAQDRTIAEIREELHTLGHTFKPNEISPTLLSLTRQKTLARQKDEAGHWTYRAHSHAKR
jgi:hypothetical protein